MFKCTECGAIFEEGEEAVWKEDRGEFWGVPCSETMRGCPKCKSNYEEAFKCRRCDEWCLEDELDDGLCECCHDELFD